MAPALRDTVAVSAVTAAVLALLGGVSLIQAGGAGQIAAPIYPLRFEIPDRQVATPFRRPEPASPGEEILAPSQSRDLASPATLRVEPRTKSVSPGVLPGLVPVSFRLSGAKLESLSDNGVIPVAMPLFYDGLEVGVAPMWIDPAGSITIDSAALSSAVAKANPPLADAVAQSGQDRTSFSSLRARGLSVNYDPINNRVILRK